MRYVHTNIIAKDWRKLSAFYQKVFGCKPLPPQRDLRGDWLDRMTGISGAHVTGEHLVLPGYGERLPTLEILSYDEREESASKAINRVGLAHLAFEVEDVQATLDLIVAEGGSALGEVVSARYPGGVTATFVYARDMEGNLLELQHWEK